MRYRSAGDATLTSGVPDAQYPAGTYDFRANVLFVGVEPFIGDSFSATFTQKALLSSVVRVSSVTATKGAQTTVQVPATARRQILINQGGLRGALLSTPLGIPTGIGSSSDPSPVQSWWVSISGRFDSANGFQTASIGNAVAGALADAVTYAQRSTLYTVPDGSALLAAFRLPNACGGATNYVSSVAAACVRPVRVSAPQPSQEVAQAPVEQRVVLPRESFYLRPIDQPPTFARVGPPFHAGTPTTILGAVTDSSGVVMRQGTLTLYRVSVPPTVQGNSASVGYAALSTADLIDTPGHSVTPVNNSTRTTSTPPIDVTGLRGPTHERFWLRSTATFGHVDANGVQFPVFPAGTVVTISSGLPGTRGSLRLYRISVPDGRDGYAAFSLADIAQMRSYPGIVLRGYGNDKDNG